MDRAEFFEKSDPVDATDSASRSTDIQSIVDAVKSTTRAESDNGIRRAYSRFLSAAAVDQKLRRAISQNGDIIGPAYERLVKSSFRRKRGQFFTPTWAGELMATWVLRARPQAIVDPGVGSGSLLLHVAARAPSPLPRLIGIDSDPLAISMARTNLAFRDIPAELLCGDFLLDATLRDVPSLDVFVCNPPYGRYNSISPETRERIHDSIRKETGATFGSRTGVAALFLIRAIHSAADGARLAFVTPSGWLDPNYGRAVLDYLLGTAHVDAKILLPDEHLLFDGVLTTAAITLITKRKGTQNRRTTLIRLTHRLPTVREVLEAVDSRDTRKSTVQVALNREWRAHFQSVDSAQFPLSKVAGVHRGLATGYNKFFVLTEELRKAWDIPKRHLRHCLSSPRLFPATVISADDVRILDPEVAQWLLVCDDVDAEAKDSPLGEYLRWGRDELLADKRYITSHRTPWYSVGKISESPIVFPYFNRITPRFIRNTTDAIPLNNFLVVRPQRGVDADALCRFLNSHSFIAQLSAHRRVYGGGLWKLEPTELASIDLGNSGKALLHD